MGTYNLPRNVKGEGRILYIFSRKSLIYTAICGVVGGIFYPVFKFLGMGMVGLIVVLIFACIGFIIGTLKMPSLNKFNVTKVTSGENIDEIVRRAIKFKMKGKKIYIYKEEPRND